MPRFHFTLAIGTLVVMSSACDRRAASSGATAFTEIAFDTATAARLPHVGTIVGGRRWRDATGEHTLLLTRTGELPNTVPVSELPMGEDEPASDAEVYGYHYAHDSSGRGDARLLWRTVDAERGCQFDLVATPFAKTVAITDLDADGVAESTFMYMLACRSDYSPATLKLMMHEGATKYAIRGTTKLRDQPESGAMQVDSSFTGAPPGFREHAVRHWNRFVTEDSLAPF